MALKGYVKKVVLFAAALTLSSVSVDKVFAGTAGMAIIDLQKALNASESGKKAMQKLKSKMDAEYDSLRQKEEELKKLEDLINRQGLLMKDREKREKEEEYLRRRKEIDRFREDVREELTRKERELTQKIVSEIITVARKIGQEFGYTLVLEKGQGVIYYTDDIDITDKVIGRYNKIKK